MLRCMADDPEQRPSFGDIYRELLQYQRQLMSKARIRHIYEDLDSSQYTSVIDFGERGQEHVRKPTDSFLHNAHLRLSFYPLFSL